MAWMPTGIGGGSRGPYVQFDGTIPTGKIQNGVIVDLIYTGLKVNRFDANKPPAETALLVVQLEHVGAGGKRSLAGRDLTLSLHEKAALAKLLDALGANVDRAKQYSGPEHFVDVMRGHLVGKSCALLFKQGKARNDGSGHYRNMDQIMPAIKEIKPDGYVRERDLGGFGSGGGGNEAKGGATGDDIPI